MWSPSYLLSKCDSPYDTLLRGIKSSRFILNHKLFNDAAQRLTVLCILRVCFSDLVFKLTTNILIGPCLPLTEKKE